MPSYPMPRSCSPSLTLTVPEAADALGVGRSTILKMLRENRLRHVRIGSRVLISREALVALVQSAASGAQL